MTDFLLSTCSALSSVIIPGRHGKKDGQAGVTLREVTQFTLAHLTAFKGQKAALETAIKIEFCIDLPNTSKKIERNGIFFIGIGPEQWVVMAYDLDSNGFLTKLAQVVKGLATLVDQSDARAILRVSGPNSRRALAKGVSVDLDPRVFGEDSAATTLVAGISMSLWQVEDTQTYELSVFRAFGASFYDWIIHSAEEFGIIIT